MDQRVWFCYNAPMARHIGAVFIATAILAVAAARPVLATHAWVGVFMDEAASDCEFVHSSGTRTAYVVVTHSIPLNSITFEAPIPSALGGYLFETSSFQTTGNSQTGISVGLGGCTPAPVTLLTVYYSASSASCIYWPVYRAGGNSWDPFEFEDCDGVTREGRSAVFQAYDTPGCCEISHGLLAPYHPWPPDGATDGPIDPTLTWELPGGEEPEGWPYVWMQFDDEPLSDVTPPGKGDYGYWTSYTPPAPLSPHTTYYWRVYLLLDYDDGVVSDTWTFTTGDTSVPAETATWGRVKALYRD